MEQNICENQAELFAEWGSKPEREDDIKSAVWQQSIDLRPNLPLTFKRVKHYTADGHGKVRYSNELECLKKTLTVAPLVDPNNSDFVLKGWVKVLDPIMSKYEVMGFVQKPKTITDPDSFIRAIVTTETYREKYKENEKN